MVQMTFQEVPFQISLWILLFLMRILQAGGDASVCFTNTPLSHGDESVLREPSIPENPSAPDEPAESSERHLEKSEKIPIIFEGEGVRGLRSVLASPEN
jgi:hypothetical protein